MATHSGYKWDDTRGEIVARVTAASGDPIGAKAVGSMLRSYTYSKEFDAFSWLCLSFPPLVPDHPAAPLGALVATTSAALSALAKYSALQNLSLTSGCSEMPLKGEFLSELTNLVTLSIDQISAPLSCAELLCTPANKLKTLAILKCHWTLEDISALRHTLTFAQPYCGLRHVQLIAAQPTGRLPAPIDELLECLQMCLPRLKSLHIQHYQLHKPLQPFSSLRHLFLSVTQMDAKSLLHGSLHDMPLRFLSLANVTVDVGIAPHLPPTLQTLCMTFANIGDDECRLLCTALRNCATDLHLEGNKIGDAGAGMIIKLLSEGWPLKELYLINNPISSFLVEALEAVLPRTQLSTLAAPLKNMGQVRKLRIDPIVVAEQLAKNKRRPALHRSRLASLPSDLLLHVLMILHSTCRAPEPDFSGKAGRLPSAKQYDAQVRKLLGLCAWK